MTAKEEFVRFLDIVGAPRSLDELAHNSGISYKKASQYASELVSEGLLEKVTIGRKSLFFTPGNGPAEELLSVPEWLAVLKQEHSKPISELRAPGSRCVFSSRWWFVNDDGKVQGTNPNRDFPLEQMSFEELREECLDLSVNMPSFARQPRTRKYKVGASQLVVEAMLPKPHNLWVSEAKHFLQHARKYYRAFLHIPSCVERSRSGWRLRDPIRRKLEVTRNLEAVIRPGFAPPPSVVQELKKELMQFYRPETMGEAIVPDSVAFENVEVIEG